MLPLIDPAMRLELIEYRFNESSASFFLDRLNGVLPQEMISLEALLDHFRAHPEKDYQHWAERLSTALQKKRLFHWGSLATLATLLIDGDRLEMTPPITIDPKVARARRAQLGHSKNRA